ncbi:MAG: hypothetical protein AABZ61_01800, partial [Bacteroidota bacterium]
FDKQLLYVPRGVANMTVAVRFETLGLNISHSLVGRRYTKEDNSESLPSYRLTNANLILTIPVQGRKLFAKAEVSNLFDKDYEVFPYYPMPRRSYRLMLGIEY